MMEVIWQKVFSDVTTMTKHTIDRTSPQEIPGTRSPRVIFLYQWKYLLTFPLQYCMIKGSIIP